MIQTHKELFQPKLKKKLIMEEESYKELSDNEIIGEEIIIVDFNEKTNDLNGYFISSPLQKQIQNSGEKRFREDVEEEEDNSSKKQKFENVEVFENDEIDLVSVDEEASLVTQNPFEDNRRKEVSLGYPLVSKPHGDVEVDQEDINVEEIKETQINSNNEDLKYYNDNIGWVCLSNKLLLQIFSFGSLTLQDLLNCLLVCKKWKIECDTPNFWKFFCFKFFSRGGLLIKNENFSTGSYNWKTITKKQHILRKQCSLSKILEEIEGKYSEMQLVIRERIVGSDTTYEQLCELMAILKPKIETQKHIQEFERSMNFTCSFSSSEYQEEILFLINNTFFNFCCTVNEQNRECTIIGKNGKKIRFYLKISHDHPQRYHISYSSEKKHVILLSVSLKEITWPDLNELNYLRVILGLSYFSESQLFFYVWKYCLSNSSFSYDTDIARKILERFNWRPQDTDLYVPLQSHPASTSLLSAEEQEEDVDIL